MGGNSVRISRAVNGFTASYDDPKVAKTNDGDGGKYMDPHREVVFTKKDELVAWLTDNLDTVMAQEADEYGDAFSSATEGKDDD